MSSKRTAAKKKAAQTRGYTTASVPKPQLTPTFSNDTEEEKTESNLETLVSQDKVNVRDVSKAVIVKYENRDRNSELYRELISALPRNRKDALSDVNVYSRASFVSGTVSELGKITLEKDVQEMIINLIKDRLHFTSNSNLNQEPKHRIHMCWKNYNILRRVNLRVLNLIYVTLQQVGFAHSNIIEAMENTLGYGLDCALDYLCLNMDPSDLPMTLVDQVFHSKSETQTLQLIKESGIKLLQDSGMENFLLGTTYIENDITSIPEIINSVFTETVVTPHTIVDTAPNSTTHRSELNNVGNNNLSLLSTLDTDNSKETDITAVGDYLLDMFNESAPLATVTTISPSSNSIEKYTFRVNLCDPSWNGESALGMLKKWCNQSYGKGVFPSCSKITFFSLHHILNTSSSSSSSPLHSDIVQLPSTYHLWSVRVCDKQGRLQVDTAFRLRVPSEMDKKPCIECPFIYPIPITNSKEEAINLAAMTALYSLVRVEGLNRPLYRLLPSPLKALWLQWINNEKTFADNIDYENELPRVSFLCSLYDKYLIKGSVGNDPISEKIPKRVRGQEEADLINDRTVVNSSSIKDEYKGKLSLGLFVELKKRESTELYQKYLASRMLLPVWQYKQQICNIVNKNLSITGQHNDIRVSVVDRVTIISGETGCGKTTQVGQMILESAIQHGFGGFVKIFVCEPRRLSAISVAKRVSDEMGDPIDGHINPTSWVGYHIRQEKNCHKNSRLVFCTTGILLRRLEIDPLLTGSYVNGSCDPMDYITHVIVDEVHERSYQGDFLLIALRHLLIKRKDLRIIIMSATMDCFKLSSYFSSNTESASISTSEHDWESSNSIHDLSSPQVISIPGRVFPVAVMHLEDVIESIGYVLADDSPFANPDTITTSQSSISISTSRGMSETVQVTWNESDIGKDGYKSELLGIGSGYADISIFNDDDDDESCLSTTTLFSLPSSYSQRTARAVSMSDVSKINFELIQDLLLYITKPESVYRDMDGAILIFLPGIQAITDLYNMLCGSRVFSDSKRYFIIPLHSTLSSSSSSKIVFERPPENVRKIVLATNIAETGITIPDVVFVIDCGLVRQTSYDEKKMMTSLVQVWTSRASARQRQGRAGRVRPGLCFRLYPSIIYDEMQEYDTPELLRISMEECVLCAMAFAEAAELAPTDGLSSYLSPIDMLLQALDPPSIISITSAITSLVNIGAISTTIIFNNTLDSITNVNYEDDLHVDDGFCYTNRSNIVDTGKKQIQLTPLGRHLSSLPVDVRIGKMLIFASLLHCLDPITTIAAALSGKSPFFSTINDREEANRCKCAFVRGPILPESQVNIPVSTENLDAFPWDRYCHSDLLVIHHVYYSWRSHCQVGEQADRKFCRKYFLDRNVLVEMHSTKLELLGLLCDSGFISDNKSTVGNSKNFKDDTGGSLANINSKDWSIVIGAIVAGLTPNIAAVIPSPPSQRTVDSQNIYETKTEKVYAHPSSTLHPLYSIRRNDIFSYRWAIYHLKMKSPSGRVYLRDITYISPIQLLMFTGNCDISDENDGLIIDHLKYQIVVGQWMYFRCAARTAILLRELRRELDGVLQRRLTATNTVIPIYAEERVLKILERVLRTPPK